jgi:hypothetical protein
VQQILDENRDAVRSMLDAHRHLVTRLRDALLDRDELIGDEILIELKAAELDHSGSSS